MKALRRLSAVLPWVLLFCAFPRWSSIDAAVVVPSAAELQASIPKSDAGSHGTARTSPSTQRRVTPVVASLPLSYEVNTDQADGKVRFLARANGYSVLLTPSEAILALSKKAEGGVFVHEDSVGSAGSHLVRMKFVDADPMPRVVGLEQLPGKVNYLTDRDPVKWRTGIPTFAKVRYEDVYPGVNVVFYGNRGALEYDIVLMAGSDLGRVQIGLTGAQGVSIGDEGDLILNTPSGVLSFRRPTIYQQEGEIRKSVEGGFRLLASSSEYDGFQGEPRVGFWVADYDKTRPLVIDPSLSYSTFLGGTFYSEAIAADGAGNAYVNTLAVDSGQVLGSVTKLNPTASSVIYTTYLSTGPVENDKSGIAVDASGRAYVARGNLVAKVSPDGSSVEYSPPLAYGGRSIAIDALGNVYVAGKTYEWCGEQGRPGAVVTKFDATLSNVIFSKCLADAFPMEANGIAVDVRGQAIVAGRIPGMVWVIKLTMDGSDYVFGRWFYNIWGTEGATGITVDIAGNAYVTGEVGGWFPTTPGAYLEGPIPAGGPYGFIMKLSPTGSLTYSTLLGGQGGYTRPQGIGVDLYGNAYVAGYTNANDFPRVNPIEDFSTCYGCGAKAFVAKINAEGSRLDWSTFFGGHASTSSAIINAIAIDASGSAYVTGYAYSPEFRTTPGVVTEEGPGVFVAKISDVAAPTGVNARVGDRTIYLSWNPVLAATKYTVYIESWDETMRNWYVDASVDFESNPQTGSPPPNSVILPPSNAAPGSLLNGHIYRLTVTAEIDGVQSGASTPVFAMPAVPHYGPGGFSIGSKPVRPILLLHGFLGSGRETFHDTVHYMQNTLGWTDGGHLSHDYYVNGRSGVSASEGFTPRGDFYTTDFGDNQGRNGGMAQQGREVGDFIEALKHVNESLPPLTLVAHSNGGLAARACLLDRHPGCLSSVAEVITYGTPHRGADVDTLRSKLSYVPNLPWLVLRPDWAAELRDYTNKLQQAQGAQEAKFTCGSANNLELSEALQSYQKPLPAFFGDGRSDMPIIYTSIAGVNKGLSLPLPGGLFLPLPVGDRPSDCHSPEWDSLVPLSSAHMLEAKRQHLTDRSHIGQGDDFTTILCALDTRCAELRLHSPVDMEVIAPNGGKLAKNFAGIAGASYMEVQDANGHVTATAIIPFPQGGNYQVNVLPKPGSSPTDTFTLTKTVNGVMEVIVQDMRIQDSPPSGITLQINAPPVGNAGSTRSVRMGSLVTLDGSGSNDSDNGPSPLTYAWTQTAGPSVILGGGGPASVSPTFTPTVPGTYTFQLVVNDGQANSAPASVTITVPPLGDIDLDGDVDDDDFNFIRMALGNPANGPNDLRDLNGDGRITGLDVAMLRSLCTRRACKTR